MTYHNARPTIRAGYRRIGRFSTVRIFSYEGKNNTPRAGVRLLRKL